MSISDAAKRLEITVDAVYRLVWGGKIRARKVKTAGGRPEWELDEADVDERLKARRARVKGLQPAKV